MLSRRVVLLPSDLVFKVVKEKRRKSEQKHQTSLGMILHDVRSRRIVHESPLALTSVSNGIDPPFILQLICFLPLRWF
jgi:hypothetical protein